MSSIKESQSGRALVDLIKRDIEVILSDERKAERRITLYKTGGFWVAFEQSAFRLTSLYSDVLVVPMRVRNVENPIVMASVAEHRVETLADRLQCVECGLHKRTYVVTAVGDDVAYKFWHDKNVKSVISEKMA